MKLQLKQPIQHDGYDYPYCTINFSASSGFNNVETYTMAMRIVPFRVTENNEVEKLENFSFGYNTLDAFENNDLKPIIDSLLIQVQDFLNK